jgi:4a-hydroxytetrahydrobiopterin dehydratase
MLAPMTGPGPDTLLSRAAASEAVSDTGWRYLLGTLALSVPVRSLAQAGPPAAA